MPADRGISLDIEFDLLSQELVCRTSHGDIHNIPLRPISVAHLLRDSPRHWTPLASPQDRPDAGGSYPPIRCDIHGVHCRYDSDGVTRFFIL
jgi:hypothetical protein